MEEILKFMGFINSRLKSEVRGQWKPVVEITKVREGLLYIEYTQSV